jgi:hypothetical protein
LTRGIVGIITPYRTGQVQFQVQFMSGFKSGPSGDRLLAVCRFLEDRLARFDLAGVTEPLD